MESQQNRSRTTVTAQIPPAVIRINCAWLYQLCPGKSSLFCKIFDECPL